MSLEPSGPSTSSKVFAPSDMSNPATRTETGNDSHQAIWTFLSTSELWSNYRLKTGTAERPHLARCRDTQVYPSVLWFRRRRQLPGAWFAKARALWMTVGTTKVTQTSSPTCEANVNGEKWHNTTASDSRERKDRVWELRAIIYICPRLNRLWREARIEPRPTSSGTQSTS